MADFTFNENASPKVKTEKMLYYFNVGTAENPEWELQGRGIESWSEELGASVEKSKDVLGHIDMERSTPEPTQSVTLKLRSDNKFTQKLAEADFTGDTTFIDSIQVLKKWLFLDGSTTEACKAKLESNVMVEVSTRSAEAGGYVQYEVTLHYANDYVTGEMPKVDGTTIKFTPDSAA